MPKFRVIHTDPDLHPLDGALTRVLEQANAEVLLFRCQQEQFSKVAADADAILNADFKLTKTLIELLRNCRIISRFGTGVDNIDVEAATARGIPVSNVPEFCTDEIANRTWTLLLGCAAQLIRADRSVREGAWREPEIIESMQIAGQTLGLVGFGKIARAVARRAFAFGMKVLAHDPYVNTQLMEIEGVAACDLETLFRRSDFLSLHVPSSPITRHLINSETLKLMKPTAILVNTARGALIDEAALLDRVQRGLLAGAGLEVFDPEPPLIANPLLQERRVIFTPHSGAFTKMALQRVRQSCVDAVVRVLTGQIPINLVNPSVLQKDG